MIRIPRAAAAVLAALALAASLPVAAAVSPVHHAIELRLDPESGRLAVADIVTVSGRTEFDFRLAHWLTVDRALIDGRPVEITGSAGAWRVPLPDTGAHRVELRLRGVVAPLPPAGGRDAAPRAASGPEGSYLPGSAAWIPATGDDWIAYRLTVQVPAPYRAVATGGLRQEHLGETTNRAVFAADYPAEPPSVFAGPYAVRQRRQGDIRLRTYFHPELADLAEDYLGDAARYLERFQDRIGAYPFRDFHIVSAPLPVGLGFPNLTYIGRTVLPLPFMRGRSLAHEVLHNWWGNGVAVDYRTGNWSEGLTTYMADHALAAETGAAAAREMRLGWLRNYAALPATRDLAVTHFTAKRHDAGQVIGYDKVAFIFHMLRLELGEKTFADGLGRFWRRQRFRVAGWAELGRAFEVAAGRDLAWFFNQWLERVGGPRLHLGTVKTWREADGFRVRLTVRQDPPAYRLTVPVLIETRAGHDRRRIVLEGLQATATLTLESRPRALHLDPGHDLFRRLLPGEAPPILRDVTLAANAVTVILAAHRAIHQVARQLAERLLDTPVRLAPVDRSGPAPGPLLVIGITSQVKGFLARAGLPGVPATLAGRGTSRVWTARRETGHPLLVVAADDVRALETLLGPLPHYGAKSYLIFDGRRAIETGIWPVAASPLGRRLDR